MNRYTDLRLLFDIDNANIEPNPDIAICSQCGWRGSISECDVDPHGDGDWESGYYPVDLCPVCEDGGCIDDYDMSEERLIEWEIWSSRKHHIPSSELKNDCLPDELFKM